VWVGVSVMLFPQENYNLHTPVIRCNLIYHGIILAHVYQSTFLLHMQESTDKGDTCDLHAAINENHCHAPNRSSSHMLYTLTTTSS